MTTTDRQRARPVRLNFTKTALDRIEAGTKRATYFDERYPGLALVVYPSGLKVFIFYRRIAGRPERVRLGDFPTTTVEQARTKAQELGVAISRGANPAEAKRAIRAEPTFGETFERFLTEKRNRSGKPLSPITANGYRKVVDTYLGGIKGTKLSSITPERTHTIIGKIKSPGQLNHAKAIVSSVFSWAKDEGITDQPNPASRLKTKAIPSRDRFLLPSELPRFMAAVERSTLRDFFWLAMFTGARRSNLQSMRWQDIDLSEATWTIPRTKNGDPLTIPLPPEALEILRTRKAERILGAEWVFPGTGKTGHLVEPKRAWDQVLDDAGLENLRLHDLRRTLGSWQARQGSSLPVIGKSLGHRSQQATAIYSRLDLDPVRTSVEGAVTAMVEASKGTGAEVIPLRRKHG